MLDALQVLCWLQEALSAVGGVNEEGCTFQTEW